MTQTIAQMYTLESNTNNTGVVAFKDVNLITEAIWSCYEILLRENMKTEGRGFEPQLVIDFSGMFSLNKI